MTTYESLTRTRPRPPVRPATPSAGYVGEYLDRRAAPAATAPAPTVTAARPYRTLRRPAAAVLRRVRAATTRGWRHARPLALPVTGFGLFTGAAGMWHLWAGLLVAGAACFVLDYNSGPRSPR